MISINVNKINADIRDIINASAEMREKLVGEETMDEVGLNAVTAIKARAGAGVDADGASFKPYSDSYSRLRARKGLSTKPNLTRSGRMLSNITTKFLKAGSALIIFTKSEEANKAAGNSYKRDFFDVRMSSEISRLNKILEARVIAIAKRLGLM